MADYVYMTIGKNIQKYRNQCNLTQKQLSEKIGKGFSTVQKYEIDAIQPPLDVLKKIADVLSIPVSYLLEDVYNNPYDQLEVIAANMENILKNMDIDTPEKKILLAYDKLNQTGKEIAVQRVEELTEIERYTKPEDSQE